MVRFKNFKLLKPHHSFVCALYMYQNWEHYHFESGCFIPSPVLTTGLY
jgi:hypothetical protein